MSKRTPDVLGVETKPRYEDMEPAGNDTEKHPIAFDGYVVGMGASAGGLEALELSFQNMPANMNAAFVVVQHLSPDHKSLMANLLARHTHMPVTTVEDGMALEANHVYLIPPASLMTLSKGRLRLTPKNPRGLSLPIDFFFSSLAEDFGNRAIGVILSGTGSDGTRGSVAINDAGGLLLAQNPESAKFDGMPRSVIATGIVDDIVAPEDLGQRIREHIDHVPKTLSERSDKPSNQVERGSALEEILHLLQNQGGIDFRDYKPATVLRRIERRMQVRHISDFENYMRLLQDDRAEVALLRRDILIPVTSFFRDVESFEELSNSAVDQIVTDHKDTQPIRVWVAGMSTGEEAYSIAILFAEAFERVRRWPNLKIFATDVEQQNVDAASAGVFSESIIAEVSPERLERFFTKRGNHFVIRPEIRQNLVFARHNLLEDPPFTRMDLVSCRNLLIYFLPNAQDRALLRMQYALAPGGYLFLGSSESLAGLSRDFSPVSNKHKLYRVLRQPALPLDLGLSGNMTRERRPDSKQRALTPGRSRDANAIETAQQVLLHDHAPPSLLLTQTREVIHIFGNARRYLHLPEGNLSFEVSRLLPPQLSPIAHALLHRVQKDNARVAAEPAIFHFSEDAGAAVRLRLIARPITVQSGGEPYLLLSFEDVRSEGQSEDTGTNTLDVNVESMDRIQSLERELATTRESLQATIEELETSNEELQATNEEMMASNEELQSSNEELQSMNEELYTVNAENQEKIQILNRLNADLDSMAKASSIATIFLNEELRITRFTPESRMIFNIEDSDIGRPIQNFTHNLRYNDLLKDLEKTLSQNEMFEREVRSENDLRLYLIRILPYKVHGSIKNGAVVSFVDVTSLRDVQRLQAVLDSLPLQVAVLDVTGKVTLINNAWQKFTRDDEQHALLHSAIGSNYLKACERETQRENGHYAQAAVKGLSKLLEGKLEYFIHEYPYHDTNMNRERRFVMHAAPLNHPIGGIVVSHIDVSTPNSAKIDD